MNCFQPRFNERWPGSNGEFRVPESESVPAASEYMYLRWNTGSGKCVRVDSGVANLVHGIVPRRQEEGRGRQLAHFYARIEGLARAT